MRSEDISITSWQSGSESAVLTGQLLCYIDKVQKMRTKILRHYPSQRLRKTRSFFVGGDMTQEQIDYVKKCIREDIHRFYVWGPWKKVRREVLQMDHRECQRCKAKKIYTKATTVHHVNYVKKHPDMALEIWYEWHGVRKRNLVSLCHDCHEAVHGYRKPEKKETLTEERWD